jgi:hypothetical protein
LAILNLSLGAIMKRAGMRERMYLRHFVAPVLAVFGLVGCQSERQEHAEISKAGVSLNEASTDLAGCRFEAEKAAGPMPVIAPIVSVAAWSGHRDKLVILCLESKGYKVAKRPGSCQGTCIGSVSFATSN